MWTRRIKQMAARGLVGSACFALLLVAHAPEAQSQVVVRLDQLVLELEIGAEGQPELFYRIRGVRLWQDEVFVVDLMNYSVRVFGFDGQVIRRFGRQGSGPGEFQSPTRLTVTDSLVEVHDVDLRRVSRFSHEGELIATEPAIPPDVDLADRSRGAEFRRYFEPRHLRYGHILVSDRPLLGALPNLPPLRSSDVNSYAVVLRPGGGVDTIAVIPPFATVYVQTTATGRRISGYENHYGHPGTVFVSGDSLVVAVDGVHGRVRFLVVTNDGLSELSAIDLNWAPRSVDVAKAMREDLSTLVARRGGRVNDYEVVVPENYGQLGSALFDDGGRLWVRHLPDRDVETSFHRWSVLSPISEEVLAVVELPAAFILSGVTGDLLSGGYRDELGVETVHVYRIPGLQTILSRGVRQRGG